MVTYAPTQEIRSYKTSPLATPIPYLHQQIYALAVFYCICLMHKSKQSIYPVCNWKTGIKYYGHFHLYYDSPQLSIEALYYGVLYEVYCWIILKLYIIYSIMVDIVSPLLITNVIIPSLGFDASHLIFSSTKKSFL